MKSLKSKLFGVIMFTGISLFLNAQHFMPKTKEVEEVKKRKLLLVTLSTKELEGEIKAQTEKLNAELIDAVKTEWKINKGEVSVSSPEEASAFLAKNTATNYFVIDYNIYTLGEFKITGRFKSYNKMRAWMLFYFGEKFDKIKTLRKVDDFYAFSVYKVDAPQPISDELILRVMVGGSNSIFEDAAKEKLNAMTYTFGEIKKNAAWGKSKTLLVPREELPDGVTDEDIKNVYPYKFKIVTNDEILKAVRENDPNSVFVYEFPVDMRQATGQTTTDDGRKNCYIMADCESLRPIAFTMPFGLYYGFTSKSKDLSTGIISELAASISKYSK